jgi:hypothetical protein
MRDMLARLRMMRDERVEPILCETWTIVARESGPRKRCTDENENRG